MRTRTAKGLTLIELLMALFIVGLVMQGFTLLFLRTWDTNKFILETGLASTMAQRANNKIIVDLRGIQQSDNGTFPIVEAAAQSLTIYTDIEDDGAVERVHYYLDQASDELRVGIRNPNTSVQPPTYANGDETTYVLAKYIVNASNDPVFYYYNDDYPGDTTNNPLTLPTNLGNIQLIKVRLLINIDPIKAPNNIYIESFVDLRNLHDYESI